jgi:anaerobic magnesium-protoporphyrin IX monomethyl ester cyclase
MNLQEDVLFINPPSAFTTYSGTRLNAVIQAYPILSYACLAAILREKGFSVSVLDLGIEKANFVEILNKVLNERKPRIIGITSTTPLFYEVIKISRMIREKLGDEVKMVLGGPHASALPEESLPATEFDIVVAGEGDLTMVDIACGKPLKDIKGIYYKKDNAIFSTPKRPLIKDLDSLPLPALDLFKIGRYNSRLINRRVPLTKIMTSRGCSFNCHFCGKAVFGRTIRYKSVARVIDEIKHALHLGFQEIHIHDDQFTTDMQRAQDICRAIIKEKLKFPWSLASGLRVDSVNEEFLRLAKEAGLYQVSFGFESGDQRCLDSIDKGITLEQSIRAMKLVKKVGLESIGFFMFGLPAETEASMKKTISFALKLSPDLAKATITMPMPDSRLFQEYTKMGLIRSRDWAQYKFHEGGDVYRHPNLSNKTISRYYHLFYFLFYFNPKWLFKRFIKSIKNRTFFADIVFGFQTFFPRYLNTSSNQ